MVGRAEGAERRRRPALDTTTSIETPEHIQFEYTLAGPARRAVAYLLDLFVRGAIVLGLFLALTLSVGDVDAGVGVLLLALFCLEWGYYFASELLMQGQSVGKRALSIRVVSADGRSLSASQSLMRNLLRAADFLPMCNALGALVIACDRRFRRLGDMAASTSVVVDEPTNLDKPVVLSPPPTTAELATLPQRLTLSPTEIEALELFLRRSSQLPPSRAEQLAALLAPRLAERFHSRYENASRFLGLVYFVCGTRGTRDARP